jgi:excisionase family DNA binding protein
MIFLHPSLISVTVGQNPLVVLPILLHTISRRGGTASGSTLRLLHHQKYIPYVKLGKFVRFNQEKVMEWVERKSHTGRKKRTINILTSS